MAPKRWARADRTPEDVKPSRTEEELTMRNALVHQLSPPDRRCGGLRVASVALRAVAILSLASVCEPFPGAAATSVQEAILRAKPATVLIHSKIGADVVLDCGRGPVRVRPTPIVVTGSGWFVDGRGYLVTNAHVVLPPSVAFELEKTAVQEGCVDPELRARGLVAGQRPDVEASIRRDVIARAAPSINVTPRPSVTVHLSNGVLLAAEVKKLSPALGIDVEGAPLPGSGRDLALLRVRDGIFPALDISTRDSQIGDAVHILGFPSLVLAHELLDRSTAPEASVTNGAVSGFRQDAIGQGVIQTDAPATHGSSGGPAIGNDAAVLGVMTFVSLSPSTGAAVQGFNFLIPSNDVRKFLEGTDVRIGESRFNGPWADALRAFFEGDYRAAAARLTRVDSILPHVPDVERVLAEAREKISQLPSGSIRWFWAGLGLTFVGVSLWGLFGPQRWRDLQRGLRARIIADARGQVSLGARGGRLFAARPLTGPCLEYARSWEAGGALHRPGRDRVPCESPLPEIAPAGHRQAGQGSQGTSRLDVGRPCSRVPWRGGRVGHGLVRRIRRALDRDLLRWRLVDLLRAEQLADHFAGPSAVKLQEIDRLFDILTCDVDDLPTPGPPRGGSAREHVRCEQDIWSASDGVGNVSSHSLRDR
jgi:S1-C subfamily serine protease